jgi:2-polyprenyl-6-methoxyphenol hydroxylase-like FAD-dependent oxidoreductase
MGDRSERARRRIIVIGGSLAGLMSGNILYHDGWDVHVYERVRDELAGRGAGIVTHPELFDVLRRAGVAADSSIGVEVASRVTFARDGRVVGERPLRQIVTSWGRLYQLLSQAFPRHRYHAGKALVAIEQDADSVTAVFEDGERLSGILLVGADGIRSTVRGIFLPHIRPQYAGYVAWRGLAPEQAFSPSTRAALFGRFAFCLPPREQMLGYPVAGKNGSTEPGQRYFNLVWYRPADEELELRRLLTGDDGRFYPDGIPPHLVNTQLIAEMRADAERVLSPQFAEAVRLAERPFLQPIHDLESPRIVFGRVALVGDAAFVARPHCGLGTTKAGGDAAALADALAKADSVAAALASFSEKRAPLGAAIVAQGRRLGAYMQAQIRTPREREMAERYRTPEAVMRETAVPLSFAQP